MAPMIKLLPNDGPLWKPPRPPLGEQPQQQRLLFQTGKTPPSSPKPHSRTLSNAVDADGSEAFDHTVSDAYDALRALSGDPPVVVASRPQPQAPATCSGDVTRRKCIWGLSVLRVTERVNLSVQHGVLVFSEPFHWYIKGRYNLLNATVTVSSAAGIRSNSCSCNSSSSGSGNGSGGGGGSTSANAGDSSSWIVIRVNFSEQHMNKDLVAMPGVSEASFFEFALTSRRQSKNWVTHLHKHIAFASEISRWRDQQKQFQEERGLTVPTARAPVVEVGDSVVEEYDCNELQQPQQRDSTCVCGEPHQRVSNAIDGRASTSRSTITSAGTLPFGISINRFSNQRLPQRMCGWLLKKGNFVPSIKLRYFVLEAGRLQYFSDDIDDGVAGRRALLKGTMWIHGYGLRCCTTEGMIKITLAPGPQSSLCTRTLEMYCENFVDKERWVKALLAHARYAPAAIHATDATDAALQPQ